MDICQIKAAAITDDLLDYWLLIVMAENSLP
ncbi:hypothetical protein C8R27_1431, partial [Nitrosomonas ureae]